MKKELEQQLKNKYPRLYSNLNDVNTGEPINYGIQCGDGWHQLIDELSAKLESIITNIGPECDIRALQCKQKWSTLRYYISGPYVKEMHDLISNTEAASGKICEECGAEGSLKGNSWYKILCNKCFEVKNSNKK